MISFFGSFQVDIGPVVVSSSAASVTAPLPSQRVQVTVSLRSDDASFDLVGSGCGNDDREGVATTSATRQVMIATAAPHDSHSAATVVETPIDRVRLVPLVAVYHSERDAQHDVLVAADGRDAARRELEAARKELQAIAGDDENRYTAAQQKLAPQPISPAAPGGVTAAAESRPAAVRILPRSATAVISVEWCQTEGKSETSSSNTGPPSVTAHGNVRGPSTTLLTSVDISLGNLERVCTQDAQYTIQVPLPASSTESPAELSEVPLLRCTVTLRLVDLSDDVAPLVRATADEDDPKAQQDTEARETPAFRCDALLHATSSALPSARRHPSGGACYRRSAPYGCMPLFHLYDHFVHFYRVHLGRPVRAAASVRRCLGQTQNLKTSILCTASAAVGCSEFAYRWDTLDVLDCSSCILGDTGFAPLAGVLRLLAGLRRLNLSQSQLGLVSAKRLVASLMGHPSLEELILSGNNFFEYAGEELLRLCKASKVLQLLDLSGNVLSPRLLERFRAIGAFQARAILNHPFRALSRSFDYITDRDSLPEESCWRLVEPLWRMIAIVPPAPPVSGGLDGQVTDGEANNLAATPIGIPLVATAPLLSNLLRSVFLEMCSVCRDPYIRAVFAPVGLASTSARQAQSEETRMSFAVVPGIGGSPDGEVGLPPFPSPVAFAPWDPEALYLHSYAKMFITTLRIGLDAPGRWDDAARVLRAVGAAHERRGVGPLLYCRANEFLVAAMEAHFPEEDFHADAKAAMIQVLALMTRTAAAGMQRTA